MNCGPTDAVWTTLVVIVNVELIVVPLGVRLAGLKLHVEFAGAPEQLSCNVWLKTARRRNRKNSAAGSALLDREWKQDSP